MSLKSWTTYVGPFGHKRRVSALHRRLADAQGAIEEPHQRPLLDQLILTVLSQATSDVNSSRAFRRLKRAYPRWCDALVAGPAKVSEAIDCGGLARQKSKTIDGILRAIPRVNGTPSIDHIVTMTNDEALAHLSELPGVGTKTACCVLLFGMNRKVIPVDTHVHRLSQRFGLIRPGSNPHQAFLALTAITPPELCRSLHLRLIQHGKTTCTSLSPQCRCCPTRSLCPSARP